MLVGEKIGYTTPVLIHVLFFSMHPSFENAQDPIAALNYYEQEALQTEQGSHPELAIYWHRAAQAAQKVAERYTFLGKKEDISEIPLAPAWNYQAQNTQATTSYITQSLQAIRAQKMEEAQRLMAASELIKKSTELEYYWILRAHEEAVAKYSFEEKEAQELSVKYRAREYTAIEMRHPELTQQWAEAACLAQEAASRAYKTKNILAQVGNTVLSHYWMMAAYWTYQAALYRAAVAEALEKNASSILLTHSKNLADLAEKAATYRSKAAKELRLENKSLAHLWTLAASWAGTAAHYQQEQKPPWDHFSQQAATIAQTYVKAAQNKLCWYRPSWITGRYLQRAKKLKKQLQERLVQHTSLHSPEAPKSMSESSY